MAEKAMPNIDIRNFPVVSEADLADFVVLSLFGGTSARLSVGLFRNSVTRGLRPSIGEGGYWYVGDINTEVLAEGKTPEFRKSDNCIEFKYTTDDDNAWKPLIYYSELRIRFDELSEEQVKSLALKFEDLTPENIAELQKPAEEMISVLQQTNEEAKEAEHEREETFRLLEEEAEKAIVRTNEAAERAEEAAKEAEDAADIAEEAINTANDAKETAEKTTEVANKAKEIAEAASEIAQSSVDAANESLEKAENALQQSTETASEFENVRMEMEDVKAHVEREFTIWFYDHAPTLNNKPAVDWTTEELKRMHDQDIYFSDSLAKVWRFVNGEWVEITDETTLAVLRKVTDLEFLRNVFASNTSQGSISINGWVGIPSPNGEPKSFLNGGDLAKDEEHGKLFLAGGVPDGTGTMDERSRNAATRMYEDGLFVSENAVIKGSVRTPWKELAYKQITSSLGGSTYGYDGSSVTDDRLIVNPQADSELLLGWGSVSDGRDVIIRVNNISNRFIYIKTPSGCSAIDHDGTKVGSGENLVLSGGYIYYLTGFADSWIVSRRISIA